jgi:hypothetical protein
VKTVESKIKKGQKITLVEVKEVDIFSPSQKKQFIKHNAN